MIFLTEWDPIGINHVSARADEYDGYIGGAIGLWMPKSTDAALVDYFKEIETQKMEKTPTEAAIERTVGALRQIQLPATLQS
jgi:hypothetical protein